MTLPYPSRRTRAADAVLDQLGRPWIRWLLFAFLVLAAWLGPCRVAWAVAVGWPSVSGSGA